MKNSVILSAIGGIGIAVSAFLPAVSISLMGIGASVSFMQSDPGKAYMLIGLGVIALVCGFLASNKKGLGWATLATGAISTLLGITWYSQLSMMGAVGFGIYIIILSGLLAVVGGLLATRGK